MLELSSQESQWKSIDSICRRHCQSRKLICIFYTDLTGRLFMAVEIYAQFRYIFVCQNEHCINIGGFSLQVDKG